MRNSELGLQIDLSYGGRIEATTEPGNRPPEARGEVPPLAVPAVLAFALLAFGVLMLTAGRYGYHRDELYFVEASKHLAWGFVDQPPLSVALVGLARLLFGDSLVGLRLFPALADALVVVLTAFAARELGGGRFPQALAALSVALGPFLIAGHLAGPTIYDLAAWGVISVLVMRILRTGRTHLWFVVGTIGGVALLNKETIIFLIAALAVGFLANRQGRLLADPWLGAGMVLAVAIWSPTLVWQAQHGWPMLEMSSNLRAEHSGLGYALKFPVIQLLLPGWWIAPVWLGGLLALLRERRFRRFRAFAIAYLILVVVLWILIPDRPYYLAGLYPVLIAAGAIVAEQVADGARSFLSARRPRRRLVWRSRRAGLVFVAAMGVLGLPLALPVLPASALAKVPLEQINYNLGEQIGWPRMVAEIAAVYRSLPPPQRATAVIFTGNYGEAGAVDRYGPSVGLQHAYSGHNTYWLWGPPTEARTPTIAIGFDRAYLRAFFGDVELATRLRNGFGVENDEDGAPVWVCRDQKHTWVAMWPALKHYG
jgi:4-amino-4-deoxy-L-arabinose transferase-like glycosyltransferase